MITFFICSLVKYVLDRCFLTPLHPATLSLRQSSFDSHPSTVTLRQAKTDTCRSLSPEFTEGSKTEEINQFNNLFISFTIFAEGMNMKQIVFIISLIFTAHTFAQETNDPDIKDSSDIKFNSLDEILFRL